MKDENKIDAAFGIIAALLVLFSSMINPVISVVLAVSLLAFFSIHKFVKA